MFRFARWVEILLGVFFLVSAGAKSVDMDGFGALVSAYNVVKDPTLVRLSSYFAMIVEVVLGAALLGGWRFKGLTHLLSAGMTVVYSCLITYAWLVHGLEDCGCIPGLIKLGPVESLIKNGVILVMLAFAWRGTVGPAAAGQDSRIFTGRRAAVVALASVVLIAVLTVVDAATRGQGTSTLVPIDVDDADRPFAQFVFSADGQEFDLGKDEYLVVFLSATCEHCQASVAGLNTLALSDDLPPFVALMIGTDKELDDFLVTTLPEFPLQQIETLTFMSFFDTAPPRLHYVREGEGVQHWDWDGEPPSVAEVSQAVSPTPNQASSSE